MKVCHLRLGIEWLWESFVFPASESNVEIGNMCEHWSKPKANNKYHFSITNRTLSSSHNRLKQSRPLIQSTLANSILVESSYRYPGSVAGMLGGSTVKGKTPFRELSLRYIRLYSGLSKAWFARGLIGPFSATAFASVALFDAFMMPGSGLLFATCFCSTWDSSATRSGSSQLSSHFSISPFGSRLFSICFRKPAWVNARGLRSHWTAKDKKTYF